MASISAHRRPHSLNPSQTVLALQKQLDWDAYLYCSCNLQNMFCALLLRHWLNPRIPNASAMGCLDHVPSKHVGKASVISATSPLSSNPSTWLPLKWCIAMWGRGNCLCQESWTWDQWERASWSTWSVLQITAHTTTSMDLLAHRTGSFWYT